MGPRAGGIGGGGKASDLGATEARPEVGSWRPTPSRPGF